MPVHHLPTNEFYIGDRARIGGFYIETCIVSTPALMLVTCWDFESRYVYVGVDKGQRLAAMATGLLKLVLRTYSTFC